MYYDKNAELVLRQIDYCVEIALNNLNHRATAREVEAYIEFWMPYVKAPLRSIRRSLSQRCQYGLATRDTKGIYTSK